MTKTANVKTTLGRNYDTPKSLVRGLTRLVLQEFNPYEGCFCRPCRLIRKAAKFSGIKNIPQSTRGSYSGGMWDAPPQEVCSR
jgi:hypothetical protein